MLGDEAQGAQLQNPGRREKAPSVLSEPWLLAIGPALGYVGAFSYEYALLTPFGLPLELIRPDITAILVWTFLYLIPITPAVAIGADLVAALTRKMSHWSSCLLVTLAPLIPAVCWLILIGPRVGMIWFLSLFGISIVGTLCLLGLKKGNGVTRTQKLQAYLRDVPLWLRLPYGSERALLVIFWASCFLIVSGAVGWYAEYKQRRIPTWWVLAHQTNAVLVRIYGGNAIFVPVDPADNSIQKTFFLVNITGESTNRFIRRKIGPLKFPNLVEENSSRK